MSRPCILILVENLPVPLDRRVWQEACALRDAGYEVVVICPRMRGYTQPEECIDGIQIYRHWISEEAGSYWGFFREYATALWGETCLAWKAWRRHRFKLMHLCNPPDLLFLVAFPFRLLGVRVIYDVHDLWPEMFEVKFPARRLLYWLVRACERLTYACANVVIATNQSVREVALQRGRKSPARVFVVRTAPKLDRELNGKPEPSLKKGRQFLVGYVGVMGDIDGVQFLMEAVSYLVHALGRKDVQFLLMGTGPEYPRLLEQRERLRLTEYVDMPGRVSNEFLFSALRTIDLGVSCDPINVYNHHCTMNKTLEYMAFGKPQVLFDLKEGRASAGDAALYVRENSAVTLGETINRALMDPAARQAMAAAALERIQTVLNWERSIEQLRRAYETALQ